MIPLRDTTPTRNYPVINTAIIGINVVVYFVQYLQGAEINQFIYIYGLVPARYSLPQIYVFAWGVLAYSRQHVVALYFW
jgi:membrane associated rhomboid family serine protease